MQRYVACKTRGCPFIRGSASPSACPLLSQKLHDTLLKYWHHGTFRDGQLEALMALLHGNDVFVRMATGAGKSLCMFLAPLTVSERAMGVIISPLNGLMDQQVNQLTKLGVKAVRVGKSSQLSDISSGRYRFVFMSPEAAMDPKLCELFKCQYVKKNLVLVAIDEAHCITEWGSDFRPSFSRLGGLRAHTDVPFMALTATCDESAQSMIVKLLDMKQPIIVSRNLDRPNIYFSTSPIKSLSKDLGGLAAKFSSPDYHNIPKTIVFTQTKNIACKVYGYLIQAAKDRQYVSMYHASLTEHTKNYLQSAFKGDNKLRCLVATIAFGMGMDIPDVELVVVYGMPSSMSHLYQLFGRAGRGGCQSRAHFCYSTKQKKVNPQVKAFSESTQNCLRQQLVSAVGSRESVSNGASNYCCTVCSEFTSDRLCLDSPDSMNHKKRRKAVWESTKELEDTLCKKLKDERTSFINQHEHFKMLGYSFVCPDSVISHICAHARFIDSQDVLRDFGLRTELVAPFYHVIYQELSQHPIMPKRRRIR